MVAVLGVDVGGSGIKGAPVNIETGELMADRFRLPTPVKARPAEVAETIGKITQHFDWKGPVGFGFPAVIQHGVARTAANIDKSWVDTNTEVLFSQATACPCYVLNDADAAGIAEMRFGVGRTNSRGTVIMVTIGTGLGTAIFVDGRLVPNLELGHLIIRGKDAETRATDAARQEKKMSWGKWSKRLNEYLDYMERLFWPDLIVLGGGVSKVSDNFIPRLKLKTPVVPAQLLNNAGMVGAALYAAERSNL